MHHETTGEHKRSDGDTRTITVTLTAEAYYDLQLAADEAAPSSQARAAFDLLAEAWERPRASTGLSDADIRLNAEGDVLGIVSSYGGETIVAGPPMDAMVAALADVVLAWRTGERP